MSPKRAKRPEALAWSLSGHKSPCPIPSAHDRLNEAHYFLHQMKAAYHQPEPFRYNLHAFIQAIESIFDMLRVDIENAWGFLHSENESVSFLLAKTCRNLKTSAMLLSIVSL